jgi:hypothetical protein
MQQQETSRMDATNATNPASSDVRSIIDAASFDEPYRFGRRPTTRAPFPFTEQQFARLLIARSRIQEARSAADQRAN